MSILELLALIDVFMPTIAGFSLIKQEAGMTQDEMAPSRGMEVGSYVVTFLLGLFGGFLAASR